METPFSSSVSPEQPPPGEHPPTPDALARAEDAVFGAVARLGAAMYRWWNTPRPQPESTQPHDDDRPAVFRDRRTFYYVLLLVLVIDQASKWAVEAAMPLYTRWTPIPALAPYFQFTHVDNTGAAFGLFKDASTFFAILAAVVTFGIAYFNYSLPTRSRKLRLALGLIAGGALGNLVDRLRLGYVTDFIDLDLSPIFKIRLADWAVFNLADLAIVSGAILMGYLILKYPPPEEQDGDEEQLKEAVRRVLPEILAGYPAGAQPGLYPLLDQNTDTDG